MKFEVRSRPLTSILVPDGTDKFAWYDFQFFNNLWTSCLALAGLLDILANILRDIIESSPGVGVGGKEADYETAAYALAGSNSFPPFFLQLVIWLDEHHNGMFLSFSLLCFFNSFYSAHNRRERALVEEERRLLLGNGSAKWRETSSVVYYGSITLQFLFLPVGFYFSIFYVVKQLYPGERIENVDCIEEKLALAVTDSEDTMKCRAFSKETLIGAIVHHFYNSVRRAVNAYIELTIKSAKSRVMKTLVEKAIKNPFRFRKDLTEILTMVRWIKYLAPLIGVGNKLLGNTFDMIKKWQLRAHAKRVERAHQLVWGEKKKKMMTEAYAATVIQTAFRSYQARKVKMCLILIRDDTESLAALRVQRKFRENISITRKKLVAKCQELQRLERMREKNERTMSDDDKRSMYQLRDELGKEAKELLNRKLLLRPNTKFAVIWKIFFVVAVLWEMTQKAVTPLLKKKDGMPMSMEELVAKTFVPTRASDLQTRREKKKEHVFFKKVSKSYDSEAGKKQIKKYPWFCGEPIAQWQEEFRDFVALALLPAPVSEWPECQEVKRRTIDRMLRRYPDQRHHWYCLDSYPALHATYRKIVSFLLNSFSYLLGTVMFLDVFVTFFTGRFHRMTGELIPTPWYLRWVVPGLMLQLIVNPNMADILKIVCRCLQSMAKIGPYRTYQYAMFVIFPIVYWATYMVVEYLWLPMVQYQNTTGVVSLPF